MGQKTHPIGFRLGIIRSWSSKWYEEKRYAEWLHEDLQLRRFIKKKLYHAGVSRIEIERMANKVKISIYTARPGIVIGKRGAGADELKRDIEKLSNGEVFLNIQEIPKAELDATLVAGERSSSGWKGGGISSRSEEGDANGHEVRCQGLQISASGRLGGAEMGRFERYHDGRVPLHTLRADIDYGTAIASTTYGVIGIKCWIFKGEVHADKGGTNAPRR